MPSTAGSSMNPLDRLPYWISSILSDDIVTRIFGIFSTLNPHYSYFLQVFIVYSHSIRKIYVRISTVFHSHSRIREIFFCAVCVLDRDYFSVVCKPDTILCPCTYFMGLADNASIVDYNLPLVRAHLSHVNVVDIVYNNYDIIIIIMHRKLDDVGDKPIHAYHDQIN